jgi:hypothetical protein
MPKDLAERSSVVDPADAPPAGYTAAPIQELWPAQRRYVEQGHADRL